MGPTLHSNVIKTMPCFMVPVGICFCNANEVWSPNDWMLQLQNKIKFLIDVSILDPQTLTKHDTWRPKRIHHHGGSVKNAPAWQKGTKRTWDRIKGGPHVKANIGQPPENGRLARISKEHCSTRIRDLNNKKAMYQPTSMTFCVPVLFAGAEKRS